MTRKKLTQEMRAISEMMQKTKNCTKTKWERTNKKQYAEYKAEHDRLRAEYDRKYGDVSAQKPKVRKEIQKEKTVIATPLKQSNSRGKTATSPKPKKIYYNEKGGVVYRQSTDKVGDTLINQAGVKYKITGERFAPPTGNPGEVLVCVLKLDPVGHKDTPAFEVNDQMLKYYREKQIMKRQPPQKTKASKCKKENKNAAGKGTYRQNRSEK